MKISKITTLSFAIHKDREKKIESRAASDVKRGKAQLLKRYMPLAQFRIVRSEEVQKGMIFKKTLYDQIGNTFYFDLAHGDLIYLHSSGFLGKSPKIERSDYISRIMNFSVEGVNLLGDLHEYGSIRLEQLDKNTVSAFVREGLVEVYEPDLNQLINFLREEWNPEESIYRAYFARLRHHIPNFGNVRYDLGSYLETLETLDDTYTKDPIRVSPETVSEYLESFFKGVVTLEGVVYLPYLVYSKEHGHAAKTDLFYPLCSIHTPNKAKRNYSSEVKLKPVSFMTRMDTKGSVPMESSSINFSDVAGMEDVKAKIREKIIHPLTNPQIAKQFGKKAGGSILFYGPPGCGKTYIARATIGEVGLNFFNINVSDIVGGTPEEAVRNIHDVFMRAVKNAPSILFFDEIDAIGGTRDTKQSGTEKAVVNQFLMELDGVESITENVLIIASTNAPWAIDPALRRAGRFTDQIFIGPPDFGSRAEIFKIHMRKKPVEKDLNFDKLAELTKGYSSADIKAICDDAIEIPWKEALEGGTRRFANMDDFLRVVGERPSSLTAWYKLAEKQIKKSGETELYQELADYVLKHAGGVDIATSPKLNFADVGDMEETKNEIKKKIIYPLKHPEISAKYGKEAGGGILMYGPPGCGKTYIAKATAGECASTFFNVKITDILSEDTGESEKKISSIFTRAAKNAPSILFFDEIDALAPKRDSAHKGAEKRLVNQFLSEMDGFEKIKGVMILASTNAPWAIDPALRRAGRFTDQIYIGPPDTDGRAKIFEIHTREKPIAKHVDFRKLAELTKGYSSADIKAICDYAAEIPWEEAIHGGEHREITTDDFVKTINSRKSSLVPWFRLAEKQVAESGESDVYSELYENIADFKAMQKERSPGQKQKAQPSEETKKQVENLKKEKERLEKAAKKVKYDYYKRKMDKESFNALSQKYRERIIDIDVRIDELLAELKEAEK